MPNIAVAISITGTCIAMLMSTGQNMYITPMPLEAMRHSTASRWGKTVPKCEKESDWELQQPIGCENQF